MVTTGEAARMLGVSRQHIVDLCDSGRLPCERMPVHRRVPLEAVAELRKRGALTRAELRSLWLNRAVAGHVARDPVGVLTHARKNLDRFEQIHEGTPVTRWLDRWRNIVDAGPERVMEVLTSTSPEAAELRQNSPFAGVLPGDERNGVLNAFADYWHTSTTA